VPSPRLSMIEGITCYPVLKKDNNQDQPALRCVKYSNLPKPERGIVLIYGPNGSGKTSIAMSLLRAPPTDFGAVAFSTFYGTPKWPHPIFTASLDLCLGTLSVTLRRLLEPKNPDIGKYYEKCLDGLANLANSSCLANSSLINNLRRILSDRDNNVSILAGAKKYSRHLPRRLYENKKKYTWQLYFSMSGTTELSNYLFEVDRGSANIELVWSTGVYGSSDTMCCYTNPSKRPLRVPVTFYFHPHMATMRNPTRSLMLILRYLSHENTEITLDKNAFSGKIKDTVSELIELFKTDEIRIVFREEFEGTEYEFFVDLGDALVPIWMLGEGQRLALSFLVFTYIVNRYADSVTLRNGEDRKDKDLDNSRCMYCDPYNLLQESDSGKPKVKVEGDLTVVVDSIESFADPRILEKMLKVIARLHNISGVHSGVRVYVITQSVDVARILARQMAEVDGSSSKGELFHLVQAIPAAPPQKCNDNVEVEEVLLYGVRDDELVDILLDKIDPRKIPLGRY